MLTKNILDSLTTPKHADLMLLPGGHLVYFGRSTSGQRVARDVTLTAAAYLGETVELDSSVTVGDLCFLCEKNEVAMEPVFARWGLKSCLKDFALHTKESNEHKSRDPNLGPVAAELYWNVSATWGEDWFAKKIRVELGSNMTKVDNRETQELSVLEELEADVRCDIQSKINSGTYEAMRDEAAQTGSLSRVGFHGTSRATRDIVESGNLVYRKGDIIAWSFADSSPSYLAALPLFINRTVDIVLEDEPPTIGTELNPEASIKLPPASMSLFQVLDGILWELSFQVMEPES